jgi:hypothetical protein
MVQKRVEKMEKSGQKWAQEGAGRKKADQDRELENIVRTPPLNNGHTKYNNAEKLDGDG